MTTTPASRDSAKSILKAAHELLQPPSALPTDRLELGRRVQASWRALPESWNEGLTTIAKDLGEVNGGSGSAEEELEEIGTSITRSASPRKQGAVDLLVGLRCLDLLVGLQAILIREFWPAEVRGGEARDFILGTADLRLLRLLLAQSLSLLSTCSNRYLASLHSSGATSPNADPPLKAILVALLSLLRPTPPPPSPGPSAPRHLPPTTITQLLITSHLPAILLSAVTLGYTPSVRPEVHVDVRRSFLATLATLPPSQALLALSGSLGLTAKPSRISSTADPSSTTFISGPAYPAYISSTIRKQLSAQLLRPTGPRGLLLSLFGERALSDAEPVEEKKVQHAIETLRRIPGGVEEERYVQHVIMECLDLLAPPAGTGKPAPRAFKAVAAGVIGVWLGKEAAGEALRAAFGVIDVGEEGKQQRAIATLEMLIGYTDPAHLPALLDLVVRPILPALELLAHPLSPVQRIEETSTAATAIPSEVEEEAGRHTAELAREVLETYERVTGPREGVGGV
ncbi:uncharacterized protein MKK02DRAFT_39872 [Dioszegia hungarica]|uniref:Uncharacterized protein n=1 Tax=Dioszegia hungarica TaxID=4972 RepID=A0AA38HE29_9TREE|nr:uncharacterized protein MKK02DRAFT_39872 [Dioszegia hungarica]KAI9639557.1 hypothetical protein MKK02DRAFT_39872 [Dioszegia hungarica]